MSPPLPPFPHAEIQAKAHPGSPPLLHAGPSSTLSKGEGALLKVCWAPGRPQRRESHTAAELGHGYTRTLLLGTGLRASLSLPSTSWPPLPRLEQEAFGHQVPSLSPHECAHTHTAQAHTHTHMHIQAHTCACAHTQAHPFFKMANYCCKKKNTSDNGRSGLTLFHPRPWAAHLPVDLTPPLEAHRWHQGANIFQGLPRTQTLKASAIGPLGQEHRPVAKSDSQKWLQTDTGAAGNTGHSSNTTCLARERWGLPGLGGYCPAMDTDRKVAPCVPPRPPPGPSIARARVRGRGSQPAPGRQGQALTLLTCLPGEPGPPAQRAPQALASHPRKPPEEHAPCPL